MSKLELAIQACSSFPLYGPVNVPDQLDIVRQHPDMLDGLLYVLSMVDSRNLQWIDCILLQVQSIGT